MRPRPAEPRLVVGNLPTDANLGRARLTHHWHARCAGRRAPPLAGFVPAEYDGRPFFGTAGKAPAAPLRVAGGGQRLAQKFQRLLQGLIRLVS